MSNITVSQSLGKKSRAVPQWWFVFGEEDWLLTQLTFSPVPVPLYNQCKTSVSGEIRMLQSEEKVL